MRASADENSDEPSRIRWTIGDDAGDHVASWVEELGAETYRGIRVALQEMLRSYFETEERCAAPLGKLITPIGGGSGSFKRLKVRFALPGGGKSGGLRLGFSVDCAVREARLGYARRRRDAPNSQAAKALLAEAESDDL